MNAVQSLAASAGRSLDPLRFPLWGSRLIEASAGTGKTYTIASLYVRLVLGHGELPDSRPLTPPDILVVTFTRAASQELSDRIRHRLNEAAACFLDEADGDDFLLRLRDEYEPDRWPACASLLRLAAEWMDDAAVSTIDAWCYRMLREHAFDSAGMFEMEMDVDEGERVAEATRDYWRLFIAPLDADGMGRVLHLVGANITDRRKTAVDCDGLAGVLRRWLPHVKLYGETPDPADILKQIKQRSDALKAAWLGWVPEVRELLQAAYDDNLYHKKKLQINHWTGWLNQLHAWACDPDARLPFERKAAGWSRLTPEGLAEAWKGDPPEHPAFEAMSRLLQDIDELDALLTRILPHAASWVAQRMAELRQQRAMLDFGGLLEQMDSALRGPNGEKLAAMIRAQFPAALIDEFQDTNPVQYRIFDSIYNVDSNSKDSLLALIGDPKQAIYRFRGADIHAYLSARRACAGRLYTLDSNYRSSAGMVAAVNHLFLQAEQAEGPGAFLFRDSDGEDAIHENPVPFLPVTAAADPGEWRVDDASGIALTLWCDTGLQQPAACAAAAADCCAAEIFRLLRLAAEGRAGFYKNDDFKVLRAGDIAILVNNRYEAADLQAALGRHDIRSVYLSDDSSVYQSAAATDVLAWLRACAEPENGGYVRAALATASLGLTWDRLDALVRDELLWEAMLDRFAAYKDQWRRRGVLPMLRRLMHEFGVPARLFSVQETGGPGGERWLTDLLHLAELMQAASVRLDGEHAVIRYLQEQIQREGRPDMDGDVSRMRLESDAGLVQIVTVHKSKGLEYPLVFYPYAWHSRVAKSLELPAVYRDRTGTTAALANIADADDTVRGEIQADQEHERLAEDLRKLYVALTRAKYATWLALAPVDSLGSSALGYLLGGSAACTTETLEASLAERVKGSAHISVQPFLQGREGRYQAADTLTGPVVWRNMRRRVEQRWSMSSYSALARQAGEWSDPTLTAQRDTATLALPDEPGLDVFLEAYAADLDEASTMMVSGEQAGVADVKPSGIHAFPKGAAPGTFLHGLLEWTFRQGVERALDDRDGLLTFIDRRCRSRGWQAHSDVLADWLTGFLRQPFTINLPAVGGQNDLILSELTTVLPEMEFWFGVKDAILPALDALVIRHFLPGRPRPVISKGLLNGILRGFADLVFEHDGRYYVADYKSNWLGPVADSYHEETVSQAILLHRYDLQAAIYLYALHRLLKARLGEHYDYEQHVGAALLFFVRGGAAAGQGLHIERPPLAFMDALEVLFEGTGHE